VIMAMHHEQDMRKMGGLRKHLKVTYVTSLIGTLALTGFPGFSGFFSKDALIEAVHESHTWGHTYAYWCVLLGVFVTSFYSFRLLFMTFHGPERFSSGGHGHDAAHDDHAHGAKPAGNDDASHDAHDHGHDDHAHDDHGHGGHGGPPHESPWVVTLPLILLAIPSIFIGWFTIGPVLFGGYFGDAIYVSEHHDVLAELAHEFHSSAQFVWHGLLGAPFWLALTGFGAAWCLYIWRTDLAPVIAGRFSALYKLFSNKFYFDEINQKVFAGGSRALGNLLWRIGDEKVIDGLLVNGSARLVGWFSGRVRQVQTGYLYTYAFTMIIGLAVFLLWFVLAR
jgi:NADH-quinone oxidoreductase subunit L